MPEFKSKEEYESWKAQRARELEEKRQAESVKQVNPEPEPIPEIEDKTKQPPNTESALMNCPACKNEVSKNAPTCPKCGEPLKINRSVNNFGSRVPFFIVIFAIAFVAFGFLRVYYGGKYSTRVVLKESFSLKDSIVNLDDLLGRPRLVVASEHPAVKKQLEEMGLIETDEQAQERIQKDIERRSKEIQRNLGF